VSFFQVKHFLSLANLFKTVKQCLLLPMPKLRLNRHF